MSKQPGWRERAKALLDILEGYTPPWDHGCEAVDTSRVASDVETAIRALAVAFAEGQRSEREACARVAEGRLPSGCVGPLMDIGWGLAIKACAAAIRRRGEGQPVAAGTGEFIDRGVDSSSGGEEG